MYDQIFNLKGCDASLTMFFSDYVTALTYFIEGRSSYEYRRGVWAVTDSFNHFSFVARNCYLAALNIENYYVNWADGITDLPQFAGRMYNNIHQTHEQIN